MPAVGEAQAEVRVKESGGGSDMESIDVPEVGRRAGVQAPQRSRFTAMQGEQPADRIVNRGLPGRVGGRQFDMP